MSLLLRWSKLSTRKFFQFRFFGGYETKDFERKNLFDGTGHVHFQ